MYHPYMEHNLEARKRPMKPGSPARSPQFFWKEDDVTAVLSDIVKVNDVLKKQAHLGMG